MRAVWDTRTTRTPFCYTSVPTYVTYLSFQVSLFVMDLLHPIYTQHLYIADIDVHITRMHIYNNIHTNTKHLHLTHTLSHIHTHVPTIR